MVLSLKVMFAEDCRNYWGLLSIGQCLVFVRTWQQRFFWGDIHVGQLPIAPFCLVHIIMFWFCACLWVVASLYCRICVTSGCNNLFGKRGPNFGSECGSCLFLIVYILVWTLFWGVVLVGHAMLLLAVGLRFEFWFEVVVLNVGLRLVCILPKSGLQGVSAVWIWFEFGLYWSEICLEFWCGTSDWMLCEFFFEIWSENMS